MTLRLTAVDLRHRNGVQALRDVHLNIAAGERVAIIGPSGAGSFQQIGSASGVLDALVVLRL
ncbi:MAG: hypothetical protein EOP02_31345, partial [Proteobacteria bacterium]